jgi:hypothetical protein
MELAGEKSTEYATILWPYFSRPYENHTQILRDLFDTNDRLFESTVTKFAIPRAHQRAKFQGN